MQIMLLPKEKKSTKLLRARSITCFGAGKDNKNLV